MNNVSLGPNAVDLIGRVFARVTVLGVAGKTCRGELLWHIRCECGVEKVVPGADLKQGKIQSCGCWRRQASAERKLTHGQSGRRHAGPGRVGVTQEYRAWVNMHLRCTDPQVRAYKHYGGRGISVCERWTTFENFFADMRIKPSPKHTLERKNVDGDYTPDNCVWATAKAQARNKRNNRMGTYQGRTMTIAEWSEWSGIPYTLLIARATRLGWSFEKAITTPVRPRGKK